ncbi:MAG TPA: efflux RND transporter periplasmic adaptor subunit [Candidatus Angelobacter sp.]|nr:efflux RND transporter periplasmic adaptor subunit [Candidatus Angelobacter sp.]
MIWIVSGCGKQSENVNAAEGSSAFPVKVVTVAARPVAESTEYLATLKSRNAASLQPQVEGDITKIFVHSGQVVEVGAPILEIDPRKQEATLNNQEAAHKSKLATMELNRIELERRQKLYSAGVIAKADLDAAQGAYDSSRADVEALEAGIREQRVQLHYYTVKAPAAGMIGDVPVHVGDRVSTTTLLTTLDSGASLEAYVNIPAEKASSTRLGLPVEIMGDDGKAAQRTRVSFISPQVDSSSQTLLLKAPIANAEGKFRTAQTVHVRVIWTERNAPVIPMTAVSRLSGKVFAFVAEGDGNQAVARQKAIQVGDLIGNDYVVLSGLQPGERLITTSVQMLADGMRVVPQS